MGFLAAIPAAFAAVAASTATAAQAAVVVSTVAATTAAASTAYGAYSSSQAAKYQGKVAAQNASIEEQNRQASLQEGAAQESIQRTATGRRVAGALAAQSANGIDVGFGSAFETRGALQTEGDLDAAAIKYNTTRRSLAYINSKAGYTGEAGVAAAASRNALIGGTIGTASSFLSSASSIQRRSTARASVGLG